MQKRQYENEANQWSANNRDPVVGSFDAHNAWEDYKYLFIDNNNFVPSDWGSIQDIKGL
jgi:hypothetical protein